MALVGRAHPQPVADGVALPVGEGFGEGADYELPGAVGPPPQIRRRTQRMRRELQRWQRVEARHRLVVRALRRVCFEPNSRVEDVAAAVGRVSAALRCLRAAPGADGRLTGLRQTFDGVYTHAVLVLTAREQWAKVVALAPLGKFKGRAPLVHLLAVTARTAIPADVVDALGPNVRCCLGATPLLSACAPAVRTPQAQRAGIVRPQGGLAVVEGLLAHPAVDRHAVDAQQRTALHRACAAPCAPVEVVQALLRAGIQADRADKRGITALHLACRGSRVDPQVVKALVSSSAAGAQCVTRQDHAGRTPLLDVCQSGATTAACVAGYLLDFAGADCTVTLPDFAHTTPLVAACSSGSLAIVRRLVADERVDVHTNDAILECIGYETPAAVQQLPDPARPGGDRGDHGAVLSLLLSIPRILATFDRDLVAPLAMGLHVRARAGLVGRVRKALDRSDRWTRRRPLLLLRMLVEARRGRIKGGHRRGRGWEINCSGAAATARAPAPGAGRGRREVEDDAATGVIEVRPCKRRRRLRVVGRKPNPELQDSSSIAEWQESQAGAPRGVDVTVMDTVMSR